MYKHSATILFLNEHKPVFVIEHQLKYKFIEKQEQKLNFKCNKFIAL